MSRIRLLWLLPLALVLVASWWARDDRFRVVIPGKVYRSAQLSGQQFSDAIAEHGLKTIVSLRNPDERAKWYREELAAVATAGIAHRSVGMLQAAPTYDRVLDLHELLQTVERPLLMHCRSGVDRSGLAGAMVLLMEGTKTLDEIAPQVSWRYGALRPDSAGKVFFAQYRDWLQRAGEPHSPARFASWLANDYVDPTGNVHFLVHPIAGTPWLKPFGGDGGNRRFAVSRTTGDRLALDGWALDSYRRGPLQDVEVFLGGQRLEWTEYGRPTPWLTEELGNAAFTRVGWAASHPMAELADGCHDLGFRFIRQDGTAWPSPPAGRICIR